MRHFTARTRFAAPIMATAMMFIALTTAQAQKTATVDAGRTYVALAGSFVSALESLGVTPGTVWPTKLTNGTVDFPISGGAIDLDTAVGQITHIGGLTLTAGKTSVTLQTFIIDTTGPSPVITGLVSVDNKMVGRLTLFDLKPSHAIHLPLWTDHGLLRLDDLDVTLDKAAATALNSVFKVDAFKRGFAIGTARFDAYVRPQR